LEKILLTQYSKTGGCSCKIAPNILQEILQSSANKKNIFSDLLVGNETSDDAAVLDLKNGTSLISTNDFFTPVVNNPFDFGKIAAANAISDVYAMGGKPLMALAILGIPIEKIPVEAIQQIIDGAKEICNQANIPLAGGHSIDLSEPIFGLCVSGIVDTNKILKNNSAQLADEIYLTKPLGLGILTSAERKNLLTENDYEEAIKWMTTLNILGEKLSDIDGVNALTDITGFGLGGHLIEMCDKKRLSVELNWSKIPLLESAKKLVNQGVRPDATSRNWNSFAHDVQYEANLPIMEIFNFLPDPQTSGGLLIAVNQQAKSKVEELIKTTAGADFAQPIGKFISAKEKLINIF
jgi:selenide, water dikinase